MDFEMIVNVVIKIAPFFKIAMNLLESEFYFICKSNQTEKF